MQIRFAVLATIVVAACYGCATEPEPQQPAAGVAPASAAVPAPTYSRGPTYRTGSRLPPMDNDAGAAPVGGVSKDDYMDQRNKMVSPTSAN